MQRTGHVIHMLIHVTIRRDDEFARGRVEYTGIPGGRRTRVIQMQCSCMKFSTNKVFSVPGNISFISHFAIFKEKPSKGEPNISESCEGTEFILSADEYIVCFQELNTSNIKITIKPTL